MEKLRIAVIGTGGRGTFHACMFAEMDDIKVVAVCDEYDDRVENCAKKVFGITQEAPVTYTNYKKLIETEKLDAVAIASSWQTHIDIAIYAMERGINAGMEVGGIMSVEQCQKLVETYERTGKFCMILQNCNYGRNELALLNMTQKNVFGEIVHLQCGYEHDLRSGLACSHENRHYRLDHYLFRNGEIYPNHGLGPMMKLIGINRGNRMISLVSAASKARGIKQWAKDNLPEDHHVHNRTIKQGDVINTIITCANGETILLTHDTSLPRPYSRGGRVQGTKGLWMEDNNSIYIENQSQPHTWENFYEYIEKNDLEHPLWKEYFKAGIKEQGHGGMDWLMLRAFVEDGLKNNKPPFDVYDSAVVSSITPLSEISIALGSQPVAIPDFTNGKWIVPPPINDTKYNLNIY